MLRRHRPLSAARGDVSGVLKLNASAVASQMTLPALLARLGEEHPRPTVEVHHDDAFITTAWASGCWPPP